MQFLVHSRATTAARVADDDPGLDERHWSYMDAFADGMTARGPTLAPDRETWTGSLHVVDLPNAEAAREFVAGEPYQRAGMFEQHLIRRFTDLLGRTMWQFAGPADEPRFLVLAHANEDGAPEPRPVGDLPAELRDGLIVYGALRHLESDRPAGVAMAVQAPSRAALDALLADPQTGLTGYDDVEVHDWEFGGRR